MTKQLPVPEHDLIERLRDYERRLRAIENRVSSPVANLSVPDVPTFGAFTTTFYQSPSDGKTMAAIQLTWTAPLNTDGTAVVDGSYYEIRYRATADTSTDWNYIRVTWDVLQFNVQGLEPGVEYAFEIRAVDTGNVPNVGSWSSEMDVTASVDTIAPDIPAAPTVAASLIAVQVTHTLGLASGGTYNLPPDLHHLEVHGGTSSGFTPDNTTLLGKLLANAGMLTANIPAVGTFPVASTAAVYIKVIAVDVSGNKSDASAAASATAELIDDAHISDLTVTKLTSGTISADVLLAGSIATASSGARVEMTSDGILAFDSSGDRTVTLDANTGSVDIVGSYSTDSGLVTMNADGLTTRDSTGATVANVDSTGLTTTGTVTSATVGTELISDPSFEGTISTSGDVGTWSYATSQHRTGSKSLTVAPSATATKTHTVYPKTAFAGSAVATSLWVKVDPTGITGSGVGTYVGIKVHFYNSSSVEIGTALLVKSSDLWAATCVDVDTQILTRSGWKFWPGVEPGEETLAVGGDWTPITAVRHWDFDGELMRLRSAEGLVDALTTPEHRWWTGGGEWRTTAQLDEADSLPLESGELCELAGFTRALERYRGVIWCPTTVQGTWLARRGDSVFFTGNKP